MAYYVRFTVYNRWPQPHYEPLGVDMLVDEVPMCKQSKVYRLRLVGSTDDMTTWPEFIVIKTTSQLQQQNTVVEVFVVLLSEYEQFVEPFQPRELT